MKNEYLHDKYVSDVLLNS